MQHQALAGRGARPAGAAGAALPRSAFFARPVAAARRPRAARAAAGAAPAPARRPVPARAAAAAPQQQAGAADYRSRPRSEVRVLVVGATGYIGKFVTRELVARGYAVTAFARERSGIGGKASADDVRAALPGADVRFGDVGSPASVRDVALAGGADVVVCCLASRTGGIADSWAVDYQATLNVLDAARAAGAAHFVLLSAICVQRPTLAFQQAKLAFEAKLRAAGDISYSIVRPTAFFKSLAAQVELVATGKPYVMFGDGTLAACKPISERDLAAYIADCVGDPALKDKVLPIGGPGPATTALDQGRMLFEMTGRPPWFFPVPVALMDGIISVLDALAAVFPGLKDSAEFGRIGRYYATESMLVWDEAAQRYDADATPEYGRDTLEQFFRDALRDGLKGQELGDAAVFGINKE